ncbi:hypothetical protein PTTG_06104 [Puccinia triticina 1-1 BBBD Race 1]|uniref:Cutinase n=1 Tax=Puccinia triticina (isolate 1-1 / race 1 (BBBD)) TaxID=630390 RepID=A0A180H3G9_PUCT1|nr:hypothetical protein PTTG_06104 [Puccinia triticina 1-1 BBBD Race 1]
MLAISIPGSLPLNPPHVALSPFAGLATKPSKSAGGSGGSGGSGGGGSGLADLGSGGCKSYMMMGARGTTETQGRSVAYTTMAQEVMRAVPGGVLHDIKYSSSAEYMRTPKEGAQTGLTYLKEHAKKCPRMVFVLMGYSKGAMVATQILASKDLPAGKVVAVVLFGNPYYKGGLPQNKCSAYGGKKDEAKAFIISKLKAVSAGGGSGGLKDTTKETESDTGAGESTGGGLGGGGILSIFGGGSRSGGGMGGGGSRPGGKAPKFGGMGKLGGGTGGGYTTAAT